MAVTGEEPISAENLNGLFPVPISLGGTGATNAGDAIVTLGIDTFVQQAVENYFDVQNAKWSGSGSFTIMAGDAFDASETFYLTQDESSADIFILSNQNIRIAKAGTYRFSGGIRSGSFRGGTYRTVKIQLSTGQQIGTASIGDTTYLSGDVLSSVTFSGPTTFSVIANPNGGNFNTTSSNVSVNLNNFSIQRIA